MADSNNPKHETEMKDQFSSNGHVEVIEISDAIEVSDVEEISDAIVISDVVELSDNEFSDVVEIDMSKFDLNKKKRKGVFDVDDDDGNETGECSSRLKIGSVTQGGLAVQCDADLYSSTEDTDNNDDSHEDDTEKEEEASNKTTVSDGVNVEISAAGGCEKAEVESEAKSMDSVKKIESEKTDETVEDDKKSEEFDSKAAQTTDSIRSLNGARRKCVYNLRSSKRRSCEKAEVESEAKSMDSVKKIESEKTTDETVEDDRKSEELDSRAAQTTDSIRSLNGGRRKCVYNLRSSHRAAAEEEKRSEDILIDSKPAARTAARDQKSSYVGTRKLHSGAPTVRSSNACEILLHAILMNEKNGTESKLFNTEYGPVNSAKQDNLLTPDQLKFTFGVPEQIPTEKTPDELELESLWTEFDFALMTEEMDLNSPIEGGEAENSDEGVSEYGCPNGNHVWRLDEEIGLICIRCSFIKVEIKYNLPSEVTQPTNNSRWSSKKSALDVDLEGLQFQTPGAQASGCCSIRREGTVWDIIPGKKSIMYPHQQEGFEFIWKNFQGTLNLNKLKLSKSKVGGGCIISHAPGTGKTRLTIVFLQTYLECFPDSRPVIIAPASMLLTWEQEFRKLGVSIPFHNLNNLDPSYTGKDDLARINIADLNRRGSQSKDILRLTKLLLWSKHKSILGISYSLYEKLVCDKKTVKKEGKELRRVLLKFPGLLVLDEGHTPRNERSGIWKALTKVDTQRRIILSGTPFQNNFAELYNILCLVRPAFANQIPQSLKKFIQTRSCKDTVGGDREISAPAADHAIQELRAIIEPFVHVHKGSILKKSLPGWKDCVVVLNPANEIQKHIINTIDCTGNTLECEHRLSLATIHPSLVLHVPHAINNIDNSLLQDIRLKPNEGSKTSFLIQLIRLSEAMKEKVLVFSQFLQPLELIKEQLISVLKWTEGKELFVMQGKLGQQRRQHIINVFNNPDSEAKVLLASTRACSEGINLVGASRVVLLDVVWNPSVEQQAISRAYRLGQTKVVYTYHLIMLGTSEWEKYRKQAEKDRLSELVFSSSSEKLNEKQKICLGGGEDRILEKLISQENLNGLIAKVIHQPKDTKLIETFR